MFDCKISLGTVLSALTSFGTIIFTQGANAQRIQAIENDTKIAMTRVSNAENDMNSVNVKIGKIETKMDEGF